MNEKEKVHLLLYTVQNEAPLTTFFKPESKERKLELLEKELKAQRDDCLLNDHLKTIHLSGINERQILSPGEKQRKTKNFQLKPLVPVFSSFVDTNIIEQSIERDYEREMITDLDLWAANVLDHSLILSNLDPAIMREIEKLDKKHELQ